MKIIETQNPTSHNEAVELVLLCQKYVSKWVFYSCFMVLSGGKFFRQGLIRQFQQDCLRFFVLPDKQGQQTARAMAGTLCAICPKFFDFFIKIILTCLLIYDIITPWH
jgi:hypothetical protein